MPQRFAGFRNGPHDKSSNDHIEGNDDGLQRLRPGRCLSQLLPAIGTNLVISIIAMILALIGGTALTILRTLGIAPSMP